MSHVHPDVAHPAPYCTQLSRAWFVPHSPSPSHWSPTLTLGDSQCGVLDEYVPHSDAATARRQLPLHASCPAAHEVGGEGGPGDGDGEETQRHLSLLEHEPVFAPELNLSELPSK